MQYKEAKQRASQAWEDITSSEAPMLLIKLSLLKLWSILLFKKTGLGISRVIDYIFKTKLTNYLAERELRIAFKKLSKLAQMRDFGYLLKSLPFDRIRSDEKYSEIISEAISDPDKFLSKASDMIKDTAYAPIVQELDIFITHLDTKYLSKGFFGKVVRCMVGVIGFHLVTNPKATEEELLKYARIGYHFGRTYLFDDILDEHKRDTEDFVAAVLSQLSGKKPITEILTRDERIVLESLSYLEDNCKEWERIKETYLTLAQATMSDKKSFDKKYSEKSVYEPVIIKSACTRLLSAYMGDFEVNEKFLQNSFTAGMANQLIDDFRDFKEDTDSKNFTPYTYYYRGVGNFQTHPLKNYFKAIMYSVNNSEIEGSLNLWLMRFSHGIRVAHLNGGLGLMYKGNKEHWVRMILGIGKCHEVIVDIEARMAKRTSAIALDRIGLTSNVVGH